MDEKRAQVVAAEARKSREDSMAATPHTHVAVKHLRSSKDSEDKPFTFNHLLSASMAHKIVRWCITIIIRTQVQN